MSAISLDPNFIHVVCNQLIGHQAELHLKLDATVNDLIVAYQNETGLHPAFQNPLSGSQRLRDLKIFPRGLNTKLIDVKLVPHPYYPEGYFHVFIARRNADQRGHQVYCRLADNYHLGLSELDCNHNGSLVVKLELLKIELNEEFDGKVARLPSQKKYKSDHPNSTVDNYVTYVESAAYQKLLKAIATDKFLQPSKALKTKMDEVRALVKSEEKQLELEKEDQEKLQKLEKEEQEKQLKLQKEKEEKIKAEQAEKDMWNRLEAKKKKRQRHKQKKKMQEQNKVNG